MDLFAFCYLSSLLITALTFVRLGQRDLIKSTGYGKFVLTLSLVGWICFIFSIFLLPDESRAINFFAYPFYYIFCTLLYCVLACVAVSRDETQKVLRILLGISAIFCWIISGLINTILQSVMHDNMAAGGWLLMDLPLSIIALVCFSLIVFRKKMHWGITLGLFFLSTLITSILLPIHISRGDVYDDIIIHCINTFGCVICLLLISCDKINNSSRAVLALILTGAAAIMLYWTINCFAPAKSELYPLIKEDGRDMLIAQLENEKNGDLILLDDNTIGEIIFHADHVKPLRIQKSVRSQNIKSYAFLRNIYREVDDIIRRHTGIAFFQQAQECTVRWGKPNDAIIKSITMHRKNKFGRRKYFEAKVEYLVPCGTVKNYEKQTLVLVDRNASSNRHKAMNFFKNDFLAKNLINKSVKEALKQTEENLNNAVENHAVFRYNNNKWYCVKNKYSYKSRSYEKFSTKTSVETDSKFGLYENIDEVNTPAYFVKDEQNEINIIMRGEIRYNGTVYGIEELRKKLFSEKIVHFVHKVAGYPEKDLLRLRSEISNSDIDENSKVQCEKLIDKYIVDKRAFLERKRLASEERKRKALEQERQAWEQKRKALEQKMANIKEKIATLDKVSDGKNISEWEIENFAAINTVSDKEYKKLKETFCVLAMLRINRTKARYMLEESSACKDMLKQYSCRSCRGEGVLPCRMCKGSGKCVTCNGRGRRRVTEFSGYRGHGWESSYVDCNPDCSLCRGKKVRECSFCGGYKVGTPSEKTVKSLASVLKRKLEQYMSQ